MFLYKVIFGCVPINQRDEAEELVGNYLSTLHHNGQLCGDDHYACHQGILYAYLSAAGIQAHQDKYHCHYGQKWLTEIVALLRQKPVWELIDDKAPKRDTTWTEAPFLYLFTSDGACIPPLFRGDNGKPIPLYRLADKHEDREAIYFWNHTYHSYDALWMGCGPLEIPVYKQLADPSSDLSQTGRDICTYIENVTKIPTFYYLMRYWGRRQDEEKRKCPGCGRKWRTDKPIDEHRPFHRFHFKCDRCRLVSHLADCTYDDQRHAVIGEWKKK